MVKVADIFKMLVEQTLNGIGKSMTSHCAARKLTMSLEVNVMSPCSDWAEKLMPLRFGNSYYSPKIRCIACS